MGRDKSFYWLLPSWLAEKLDRYEEFHSNEPGFDEAWDALAKQYKSEPKAKWAPADQVFNYYMNKSDTSENNVTESEPIIMGADLCASEDISDGEVLQTAAVAERSEDSDYILQASEDTGEVVGESRPNFKKHKHRRY